MKRALIFSFLLWGLVLSAQDDAVEMAKVDSLISIYKFDKAEQLNDSLINEWSSISKRRSNKQQLLQLKYRKAFILDEKQNPPASALKVLLDIKDEIDEQDDNDLKVRVYLLMALCHEKSDNFKSTRKYLDLAYRTLTQNNIENLFSTYFLRRSSYDRFVDQMDSSFYHAKQAELYAKKYHNTKDLIDSYLLLENYYSFKNELNNALHYSIMRLENTPFDSLNMGRVFQLNNIAKKYLKIGNMEDALAYSDSAYLYMNIIPTSYKSALPKLRSEIFERMGNTDSAYFYFKKFYNFQQKWRLEEDGLKSKQLEEIYQNNKKEETINSQYQQITWIVVILGIIAISAILLTIQNRKIKARNKTIQNQLEELSKALDQKQVLLSELQHRVKNNLQHVISILEIQKESVDFNSIEELIRGNQNRIHSMALLHKKLNVSDNVNDIDLNKYVTELADLVKHSYDNTQRKISLQISCPVEHIEIDKALPVGLIITELVSNSMKHAFNKQTIGIISIHISADDNGRFTFNYADNGTGYDFNKTNSKGLGQEIIKGLINQLDGVVVTSFENGFDITINFN